MSAAGERASAADQRSASPSARYVAIITDGNGRWARARGVPVNEGHSAGRRHRQGAPARRRRARHRGADRVLVLDRELVAPGRGGAGADGDVLAADRGRDARAARGGRADALHRAPRGHLRGARRADGLGGRADRRKPADHAVRRVQLRRARRDPRRRAPLRRAAARRSSAAASTRPRCTTPT